MFPSVFFPGFLPWLSRSQRVRRHRRTCHLTIRERDVLELLVAAQSNREIARALGIEERTVKAHIAKLMRKVGVDNRIALSVFAVRHALFATSNNLGGH